jgi:hypothetical protein
LHISQALVAFLLPPLVYNWVAWWITFHMHFMHPTGCWIGACFAIIPFWTAFAAWWRIGKRDQGWSKHLAIWFFIAWVSSAIMSEVNYWYNMHPFYALSSLKTYTDIDPTEVSGSRVMDAGKVGFVKGSRVVTDLAMTFTAWDIFCVAPISTPAGLPSQGSKLASYDFWAIGVNCCKSGQVSFNCGGVGDISSRSGLRLVDQEQYRYFRLAVEQAEAAYGIAAKNPAFFYWVQDPDRQLSYFFQNGFKTWIMMTSLHFVVNVMGLVCFIMFNAARNVPKPHELHAHWHSHIADDHPEANLPRDRDGYNH